MDKLLSLLSKCACNCKSDCCENQRETSEGKQVKRFFHIEAKLGKPKGSTASTPDRKDF
jgi:hypothetical protein